MDILKKKLLINKEELEESIENDSAFKTEKLLQIVADTIKYITNDDYLNKVVIAKETELEEVKSKESINIKSFCINQIGNLDQYKDNNQFVQGQLYILKFLLSELKKIGDD